MADSSDVDIDPDALATLASKIQALGDDVSRLNLDVEDVVRQVLLSVGTGRAADEFAAGFSSAAQAVLADLGAQSRELSTHATQVRNGALGFDDADAEAAARMGRLP